MGLFLSSIYLKGQIILLCLPLILHLAVILQLRALTKKREINSKHFLK